MIWKKGVSWKKGGNIQKKRPAIRRGVNDSNLHQRQPYGGVAVRHEKEPVTVMYCCTGTSLQTLWTSSRVFVTLNA